MIELVCGRCKKTFERRGYKAGKKPYCLDCQRELEDIRVGRIKV